MMIIVEKICRKYSAQHRVKARRFTPRATPHFASAAAPAKRHLP